MCLPPVDSLGINNDLKMKLQDVLIPERLLTLGHMLGKGECNNNNNNTTMTHISCKPQETGATLTTTSNDVTLYCSTTGIHTDTHREMFHQGPQCSTDTLIAHHTIQRAPYMAHN